MNGAHAALVSQTPAAAIADVESQAVRLAALRLCEQLDTRSGPLEGDPFDADLWMGEAAEILAAVARA